MRLVTLALASMAMLALGWWPMACSGSSAGGAGTGPGTGSGGMPGTGSSAVGGSGSGGASTGASTAASVAFPSDDPDDWVVDTSRIYDPVLSAPRFVSPQGALPAGVVPMPSNNNVAIAFHDGRLFLAFRTAPTHFASADTRLYAISSPDQGRTWEFELAAAIGADIREPAFVSLHGRLFLYYFEAGTNPIAFEPRHLWRTERTGPAQWTAPATWGAAGEIVWDVKVRKRRAYMTGYKGAHYAGLAPGSGGAPAAGLIDVFFRVSDDGISWADVDPWNPVVYSGGVSEVAFEFDEGGGLWAVTRNEDGDLTGFGSHVATAAASDLGRWAFPARSDPERYDSPELIRHGKDLYLIARRDLGGPFDVGLSSLAFDTQRLLYLAAYSARPKRTTLYALDRAARRPVALVDLPSCGDTAFASAARTGPHTFLIANYTSPLGNPDRTWIHGQVSPQGTHIYLVELEFRPR